MGRRAFRSRMRRLVHLMLILVPLGIGILLVIQAAMRLLSYAPS